MASIEEPALTTAFAFSDIAQSLKDTVGWQVSGFPEDYTWSSLIVIEHNVASDIFSTDTW